MSSKIDTEKKLDSTSQALKALSVTELLRIAETLEANSDEFIVSQRTSGPGAGSS